MVLICDRLILSNGKEYAYLLEIVAHSLAKVGLAFHLYGIKLKWKYLTNKGLCLMIIIEEYVFLEPIL